MQTISYTSYSAPTWRPERWAGVLYLVIIFSGITSEMILRGPLLASFNPAAGIAHNLGTFRISLLGDITMLAADIGLAVILFRLIRFTSPSLAVASMVFRLMQAALIGTGVLMLAAVPLVVTTDPALVSVLLESHAIAYDIGLIFFGIGTMLLVIALWSRNGVPTLILTGLFLSGLIYIGGGIVRVTFPAHVTTYEAAFILPFIAESAFCLWLLIKARV